jgi:tetratricopeptide (TPR) repeat protein
MSEKELHASMARATNGRVWALLEQAERSEQEAAELLYAAFASCYHWLVAGTAVHQQRGTYLIAKVYIALGNGPEALRFAQKCLALTEAHQAEMADFDHAFAYEILARSYAMMGNTERAQAYYAQAIRYGEAISDEEDRTIFENDLANGPWFGVQRGNSK